MDEKRKIKTVLSQLMRFCSLRERHTREVIEKIQKHNLEENDVTFVIEQLISLNFLNEKRYVAEFVYSKHHIKKWGKAKIRSHLYHKGINSVLVEDALHQIEEDSYEEKARTICQKKISILQNKYPDLSQEKIKLKTVKYLQSKGYELDLVFKVLGDVF